MDGDESGQRGTKRARRAAENASDAGSANKRHNTPSSCRPTPSELQEALDVIWQMKAMEPPLMPRRGQPPKPNVVACALTLQRGEHFADDRAALRLFGVHPETKVRELWVDGKLAHFAPAGIGVPGEPALPHYLLERSEDSSSSSSSSVPYVSMDALRARFAPSQSAMDGSNEAAEADDYWLQKHLGQMALRLRQFAAWEAQHGAEREAELADIAGVGDEFYWALAHEMGRRPKWQLRKGDELAADATRTIGCGELGINEPVLLYRRFRPFTGDRGTLQRGLPRV